MANGFKAHLMVLLATLLVAGSFIISKKLAGVIHPISLNLLRFIIASLVLAPFVLLNPKKRSHILRTIPRALIISFFYALYFIAFFKALEYTTALNTGTLYTLVPLITGILCIFFFKERISKAQLGIYFFGIVGTLIVVFKGDIHLLLHFTLGKGDLIYLGAIISMAIYSITMKYLHRTDDELSVLVFMTLVGGSFWMLCALLIFSIPLEWTTIGLESLNYLLYLAIVATFFTVYLYQKATIAIGPKKVMAYIYLSPATIALLLFLLDGITLSGEVLVGIGISAISTLLLLR